MGRRRETWLAAVVICLGFFMIMLDTAMVYVALPSILAGLATSFDLVLWVINAATSTRVVYENHRAIL